MNNPKFGIPDICQKMNFSRTHTHKKLKALTGKSTSHFIRTIRLHKAKELIDNKQLNVNEVAKIGSIKGSL